VSTRQPLIGAFGEPRSLRECVAAFLGRPRADLDLLKDAWARLHHPRQSRSATAESSFRRAVHDGFAEAAVPPAAATFDARGAADAAPRTTSPGAGRMALVLFPTVSMRDGRHAENPWLHELPDPLTKQVWGNVACLSPKAAEALGVEDGDVVRVSAPGGPSIELPALRQPGLADRTVAVALGYGRRGSERFADLGPEWIGKAPTVAAGKRVGTDASPFLSVRGGAASYAGAEVTVARTGAREDLALSQTWSTLDVPKRLAPHGGERRDAVRETTVAALAADPRAGNPKPHGGADLWPDEPKAPGPRWRMAIDLSACTGCSACVVACQAENNVPVVGKDEVRRRRDLHWMRIDRYYADAADGDVDVVHQPMLCHHCGNAPCETVCPVLATVHSSDGLNAQVYNRCVGTRYCANNCPYKVRRFNWFSYDREDPWADLALNPDVAVRSRGVMEKCSFCVQRLQEAGAAARRAGRPMADGEAKTACQQSCPAQAIVFGDANDPKSRIAAVAADPRHYRVLQELNVDPSVGYLVRVRNREGVSKGASHD
jgi:molybdopterin-containing oxidoreductase family iron-sulfur binding subunit